MGKKRTRQISWSIENERTLRSGASESVQEKGQVECERDE
jgi:hypothetical protein